MLRWLVVLLLLLNVGLYARGQGWLLAYGWGPTPQREPQRLAQQVHPEAVQIVPAAADAESAAPAATVASPAADTAAEPALATSDASAAAPAPALQSASATPAATACWQVTDIDPAQADALRPLLLANFSEGVWALDASGLPERWMVYMGKFPNAEELAKKREQLAELKVAFAVINSPAWGPGLSLGVFSAQESANTALQELSRRGVRSARVVRERPSSLRYRLRLPAIGQADQPALLAVKAALSGRPLVPCTPPVTTPAAVLPAQAASR